MKRHRIYQRVRTSPTLKRGMGPLYQSVVGAVSWFPGPKILVNSLPKAGTHLLMRLVQQLPRTIHSGRHLNWNDYASALAVADLKDVDTDLLGAQCRQVRSGHVVSAHFPYVEGLDDFLTHHGVKTAVIVRDPRDVVVSHSHYALKRPDHRLHRRYRDEFQTSAACLLASITGFPEKHGNDGLLSIVERLRPYEGWLSANDIHVCRFEDIIGPQGGGSEVSQINAVQRLAEYLSRPVTVDQTAAILRRLWSPKAATFRAGRIRDWERCFSTEHRETFNSIAGDQLKRWGYEL